MSRPTPRKESIRAIINRVRSAGERATEEVKQPQVVGFSDNIEELTKKNDNYRKVIYTAKHMQLVLMSLKPKEEIGEEVHDNDQFFRFEEGRGRVFINGKQYEVINGSAVVVPAGAKHNIVNISETQNLKLYTVYAPPKHVDGLIESRKEDEIKEQFDGKTTEEVAGKEMIIGGIVTVPPTYQGDPLRKQGQKGKVVDVNTSSYRAKLQFSDGAIGEYDLRKFQSL